MEYWPLGILKSRCYVLGCRQPAIVGCRHRRFGRVVSCAGHDPGRHGYGVDLVPTGAQPAPAFVVPDAMPSSAGPGPDDYQEGTHVPRVPHPAPIGPAGGLAELATLDTRTRARLAGW